MSIDLKGLDMTPAQVEEAVRVDPAEWDTELASIEEWFANFGELAARGPAVRAGRPEGPPGLGPHRLPSFAPLSQGTLGGGGP